MYKVRKRTKIRNRYNQAPHLTQDTNGIVTTSQLDITNVSQEVSLFPVGNRKSLINRRARKHNKNKTEIAKLIHKGSTDLGTVSKIFYRGLQPVSWRANLTLRSDVDQDT